MILIGDLIRRPCNFLNSLHGDWMHFRIEARGIIPIMVYVRSEKGAVLSGLSVDFLTDQYNDRALLSESMPRLPAGELTRVLEVPDSLLS
jgi:hypothetical protein